MNRNIIALMEEHKLSALYSDASGMWWVGKSVPIGTGNSFPSLLGKTNLMLDGPQSTASTLHEAVCDYLNMVREGDQS